MKLSGDVPKPRNSVPVNAGAAMIDILVTLADLEPSLPDRLAPVVKRTSRNHLARSAEQVYPRRPDLAHFARNILLGWYIGTNIANRETALEAKYRDCAGRVLTADAVHRSLYLLANLEKLDAVAALSDALAAGSASAQPRAQARAS